MKKWLLDFKTGSGDIESDFEKHRAELTEKLKNVMRLSFIISALYCVAGVVSAIVLAFMGIGAVEALCLITLGAFSGCLSLLALNRNSTVMAALLIVSAIFDVVWFLVYTADNGWRGAGAVLVMALLGILNFLLSCLICVCGSCCEYLKGFSPLNLDKNAVMLKSHSLVKIDTETINTTPSPVSLPNLKDYIEEPVKTETEKMADELELAFKTAKLS